MTDFDQRWQKLSRSAAGAPAESTEEMPFGFTARVLSRCRQAPVEPWEDILTAFGVRALLVTSLLALASAGVGFFDWYDFRLERPRLEQNLTSELPWP